MDDLRTEIRKAFDEDQMAHPPMPNLRSTIVHAAHSAERGRENRWQWVAAVAAVLLAAVVIAALMSTRLTGRPVPSRPLASPSPASSDYGPPPAGVSLIYVANPTHAGWYTGFDWSGQPRGTVKLAQPLNQDQFLTQAPDGSGFVVAAFKGLSGELLDRLGQPFPDQMQGARLQSVIWSDDSRQLCVLIGGPSQWSLGLLTPGQGGTAATNVVALDSSNLTSGDIAIRVASCSPAKDRAVLVYSYFERPTEAWIVRISDGAIVKHEIYPADQLADIVPSGDGSLLAYNSNLSTGYLLGGTAPKTTIRRASDGSLVTNLDPSMAVVAFSADSSRALVTTTPWASGVATHLAMVDVSTGAVLWRYDTAGELAAYRVQPNGESFAVMMQSTSDQSAKLPSLHSPIELVIVHPDGKSTLLPGQYLEP